MRLFKASEILQFAVRIEENGEKFYRHATGVVEEQEIKDLFQFLADEEVKHKQYFQELLGKLEDYEPPEKYAGEYLSYMSAYADNIIFPLKNFEEKMKEVTDAESAINFAIRHELDSILYYHEMKQFVPHQRHDMLETVIQEERIHFLKLMDIKKQRGQ